MPDATTCTGIRFIASYQRMGDGEGADWFKAVFDMAAVKDHIADYNLLACERGLWGLELLVFTVDVPPTKEWLHTSYDEASEKATTLLNSIIGDSDVEVLWASAKLAKVVGS